MANGTHLYDHAAPDGTRITVTAGDVSYFGICNCMTTSPGVLIDYVLPDGTRGATPSLERTERRNVDVQIDHSWNIGPGFVAARTSDRVAAVQMRLADGRTDEIAPVGGWVVFEGTIAFERLEAFDLGGNLLVSCVPVQNATGC